MERPEAPSSRPAVETAVAVAAGPPRQPHLNR